MIPRECKRLAEVDFPIAEVSKHAAREKSIRHGHPSTLHLWWARRPLASSRAGGLTDEGLLLKEDIDFHRRYSYYLLYLNSDTATLRVAQNRGNEELLSFL